MTHKVVTAPTTEPITRAEAKLHLRLDDVGGVHPDDALIDGLITAAREYAQHYASTSIGSQTLEMALDEFPEEDYIDLDMPPVTSVTSIKYTDTAGVEQTMSTSYYALSTYGDSRRVSLTYGNSWPTTREEPNAVRIRYAAGAATLPKAVKSGMLLHVDLHYPGNSYTPTERENMQKAIDALLGTKKVWGF